MFCGGRTVGWSKRRRLISFFGAAEEIDASNFRVNNCKILYLKDAEEGVPIAPFKFQPFLFGSGKDRAKWHYRM
jgi:hypothetical protein